MTVSRATTKKKRAAPPTPFPFRSVEPTFSNDSPPFALPLAIFRQTLGRPLPSIRNPGSTRPEPFPNILVAPLSRTKYRTPPASSCYIPDFRFPLAPLSSPSTPTPSFDSSPPPHQWAPTITLLDGQKIYPQLDPVGGQASSSLSLPLPSELCVTSSYPPLALFKYLETFTSSHHLQFSSFALNDILSSSLLHLNFDSLSIADSHKRSASPITSLDIMTRQHPRSVFLLSSRSSTTLTTAASGATQNVYLVPLSPFRTILRDRMVDLYNDLFRIDPAPLASYLLIVVP